VEEKPENMLERARKFKSARIRKAKNSESIKKIERRN
jgi:hypothetical protein